VRACLVTRSEFEYSVCRSLRPAAGGRDKRRPGWQANPPRIMVPMKRRDFIAGLTGRGPAEGGLDFPL
jgi:hypothetical protein